MRFSGHVHEIFCVVSSGRVVFYTEQVLLMVCITAEHDIEHDFS